jgi:hypothetical protein
MDQPSHPSYRWGQHLRSLQLILSLNLFWTLMSMTYPERITYIMLHIYYWMSNLNLQWHKRCPTTMLGIFLTGKTKVWLDLRTSWTTICLLFFFWDVLPFSWDMIVLNNILRYTISSLLFVSVSLLLLNYFLSEFLRDAELINKKCFCFLSMQNISCALNGLVLLEDNEIE